MRPYQKTLLKLYPNYFGVTFIFLIFLYPPPVLIHYFLYSNIEEMDNSTKYMFLYTPIALPVLTYLLYVIITQSKKFLKYPSLLVLDDGLRFMTAQRKYFWAWEDLKEFKLLSHRSRHNDPRKHYFLLTNFKNNRADIDLASSHSISRADIYLDLSDFFRQRNKKRAYRLLSLLNENKKKNSAKPFSNNQRLFGNGPSYQPVPKVNDQSLIYLSLLFMVGLPVLIFYPMIILKFDPNLYSVQIIRAFLGVR